MRVILKDINSNPIEKIYKSYRICYSKDKWEDIRIPTEEEMVDFILDKMDKNHTSPLEHVSVTFIAEGISRSCLSQLTRHRTFKFNCISGDTILYRGAYKVKKTTVKEFYEMTEQYRNMSTIRCLDINSKELVQTKVLNVWKTGVKDVYEVTAKNGYKVKTTLDHRFLSPDGWKELKDLTPGDIVYTNGIDAYKDKDWLNQKYNIECLSQEEIGALCNVSKHTIRSWVRKHNLQKEMGSWSVGQEPPNKGKTKYNYEPTRIASEKLKGNSNNKNRVYSNQYDNVEDMSHGGKRERAVRNYDRTGICELCGEKSRDVHHIDHDLNNINKDNLIELCTNCHEGQHSGPSIKVVQLMEISNIKYIGEEEVYDIEVEHSDHNFIGNGFVLHNCQSQRYIDAKYFNYIIPNLDYIKDTEKRLLIQNCYKNKFELIKNEYQELIELGVAKEDARAILPQATTCNLEFTVDINNFRKFLNQRVCEHAQLEIRDLAYRAMRQVKNHIPFVDYKILNCQLGLCNDCRKKK